MTGIFSFFTPVSTFRDTVSRFFGTRSTFRDTVSCYFGARSEFRDTVKQFFCPYSPFSTCMLITDYLLLITPCSLLCTNPYLRIMAPEEIQNKRILISPLNWGMGHVSRCIPMIDHFLKNGNEVVVACNPVQQEIFKAYFTDLSYVDHLDYPFDFAGKGSFELDLMKQFGALRSRLKSELKETESLVKHFGIDIVISDHRYCFRSSSCYSIFLSHQLNLPVRWYEKWVQRVHHGLIRDFDEVWVPDLPDSSLAGKLSVNDGGFAVTYIGPLSRFELYPLKDNKDIATLTIISGPEIYGIKHVTELLERGLSENELVIVPLGVLNKIGGSDTRLIPSSDWSMCDQLILRARKIISRSGYSTLMDIHQLKVPFEVSPTPGQREQEYLAELWNKKTF